MAVAVPLKGSNLIILVLFFISLHGSIITAQNWLNHGGDIYNRRYAEKETLMSPSTVSMLTLRWVFNTSGSVATTPAMYDGVLYFPSSNGYIYAVKALDGSQVWNQSIPKSLGQSVNMSSSTPTIAGDLLIVGIYGPAFVVALNRSTGELVWSQQLDDALGSYIAMSGTYHNGAFYVGTASLERIGVAKEGCCTFRGSFLKLNATTGNIIWRTYMLPDNYAGAGIWGSSPSIDVKRNHVYVATGNLFSGPSKLKQCLEEAEKNQTGFDACIEPDNHASSTLALDLDTGEIKWFRRLGRYDSSLLGCVLDPKCPLTPPKVIEFAGAPMMLSVVINGTKTDVVSTAHKNCFVWSLDRDTGNIVSAANVGQDWGPVLEIRGAATDEKRIYLNTVGFGDDKGWVAVDSVTANGTYLWLTGAPRLGSGDGPVIIANGVLFGGSLSGHLYALDADTGKILWWYELGGSVRGGALVSNGCVYIGKANVMMDYRGTSLFAFCIM